MNLNGTQISPAYEAACVAHDLSSPIATIEMCLFLLSHEVNSEKLIIMKTALQNVRDISNKILNNYRDCPTTSTKSTRNILHDSVVTDQTILLAPIIKHVVALKDFEWINRPHIITMDFSMSAIPLKVKGSTTDLKRLISNLLNNAIESCDALARIHMQLELHAGKVRLSITDNGIGMTAAKLDDHLSGFSTKHHGKGLGLFSAAHYMQCIGGTLEIKSEVGVGTTIHLDFCVAD